MSRYNTVLCVDWPPIQDLLMFLYIVRAKHMYIFVIYINMKYSHIRDVMYLYVYYYSISPIHSQNTAI